MKKIYATVSAFLIAAFMLTGCSMAYENSNDVPLVTQDSADSDSVLEALENATTIDAKKAVLAFGDKWTISADGIEVGEIRGEAIYLLGDTYSLFSTNGNLVGSEGEAFRVINHQAKLYDYNNIERGMIQEHFSMFLAQYSFLNADGVEIGKASQKLNITMNFNITDMNDVAEYKISKSFLSFGAKVKIEKLTKDTSVSAIDALWLAVIASEVDEAKNSKSNSNNNN